jgi:hypothetical protein
MLNPFTLSTELTAPAVSLSTETQEVMKTIQKIVEITAAFDRFSPRNIFDIKKYIYSPLLKTSDRHPENQVIPAKHTAGVTGA